MNELRDCIEAFDLMLVCDGTGLTQPWEHLYVMLEWHRRSIVAPVCGVVLVSCELKKVSTSEVGDLMMKVKAVNGLKNRVRYEILCSLLQVVMTVSIQTQMLWLANTALVKFLSILI